MQTGKEMTGKQAFAKLAVLCAKGEHCQHEMAEKMTRWGMDEHEQAEVMERLVAERYVDDERFARAFVNDKIRYDKWGRRKVEQALRLKHIDSSIIGRVLDEVDDSEYLQTLAPLLRQKRKTIKARSEYEATMKLVKYALGRGFTIDIIRQCIAVDNEDEFLD